MARYLFSDNNLADLENIDEARINLGLGDVSTMSSNDVLFTGGTVSIDSFTLHPNETLLNNNYFLKSQNVNGLVDWYEIPAFDWLKSDQNDVNVSGFKNDAEYVLRSQLKPVAFSGDWNDIDNIPVNLSEIYSNDILDTFLNRSCNLSDIYNKSLARSHLGLGTMALQDVDDVNVSNLRILSSLTLLNYNDGYLYVDNANNVSTIKEFDLATNTHPGIVYTCNDNVDNENFTPTSSVIYNLHSNISVDVDSLKLTVLADVVNLFDNDNFLMKSNLLSEYSTDEERTKVRSNLGLGSLSTQNSNDVFIHNLDIESLKFKGPQSDGLLYFDVDGTAVSSNLPAATQSSPGIVYAINDFDNDNNDYPNNSVISYSAFSNYVHVLNSNLDSTRNSIPNHIDDLNGGADTYLQRQNNLSDLLDIDAAKNELGLATVATTGLYKDLNNRPYDVSSFSNNIGFMYSDSNLKDVSDVTQCRRNLGLGSMALQDTDNVSITGGFAKFNKLQIKKQLLYQGEDGNNPEGKVLVCTDARGKMGWKELPKASLATFGLVKLTDFIKTNDTRTDVVPTCRVFKEIEDRITNTILNALSLGFNV